MRREHCIMSLRDQVSGIRDQLSDVQSSSEKIDIHGMEISDLESLMGEIGEPAYAGRQAFRWAHKLQACRFDEMTSLSKALRSRISTIVDLPPVEIAAHRLSVDGTEKFLFRLQDGEFVESVLIPEEKRLTLCISSQVGCRLGCTFCATGRAGFMRNLTTAEIVRQVYGVHRSLARERRITNIVLMGMGEPLLNFESTIRALSILCLAQGMNFSPRRITLSTVGIIPQMERLKGDFWVNLAVSLNAASSEVRERLMPVERSYPIDELLCACRTLPMPGRSRITFEYVLIRGENDSLDEARALACKLRGLKCKINLIRFNPIPGIPYRAPDPDRVERFRMVLIDAHYNALVRESRGADIAAACGQLRGEIDAGGNAGENVLA